MAEFDVNGLKYRSKKLNPFVQANIARRLIAVVPALGPLGPLLRGLTQIQAGFDENNLDISSMNPLFNAIGKLTDEDTKYILAACLAATDRQAGPGWQAVWNVQADQPQFNDIDFQELMMICWNVISDNLGSFTRAPSPGS